MFLQSLTGYWQFRQIGQDDWLPAIVPGGVHTDLIAAGRIPDPFAGDNELRVAWVAESDWEYRRSVTIDPDVRSQERVLLVCDGLDTLATVIFNGTELGQTDNMFRRYRWDVKHLLHDGANDLVVRFASPVRYITERQAERPLINVSQGIAGAPYLRKAPCQFGWDWGPQLPPIGIWRDIRLEGRSIAEFADVQLRQHHGADEVALTVDVQAMRWDDTALTATIQVTTPTGATLTRTAALDGGGAQARFPIAAPQLWWPNGYGSQPLYQVAVTLHATDQPGAVVDRRDFQVGLRTIELRQEEDEFGRSFTFFVNGVPIFAKGSNWIPADSFPTQLTDNGWIRCCARASQRTRTCCACGGEDSTKKSASTTCATATVFSSGRISSFPARSIRSPRRPLSTMFTSKWSKTCSACATAPAWRSGAATTRWRRAGRTGRVGTRRSTRI